MRREMLTPAQPQLSPAALAETSSQGGGSGQRQPAAAIVLNASGLQDQTWQCAPQSTYQRAAERCQDVGVFDRDEYGFFPDSSPCGCQCCRRPVKALWECYPQYNTSRNESWRWCQDVGVREGWEYQLFHRVKGKDASVCGCDCCRRSIEVNPGLVNVTTYGEFVAEAQELDGLMRYRSNNISEADLVKLFYIRESKQWRITDTRTPKHEFVCTSPRNMDSTEPRRASGTWQCGEAEDDGTTPTNMSVNMACPWAFTAVGAEDDAWRQMGTFVITNLQPHKSHGWRLTYQNSRGNYIYYLAGPAKWLIGDSWNSEIATVQCTGNSTNLTCPGDCPTWQVASRSNPAVMVNFPQMVNPAECPTQIYLAGSRFSGYLSHFGQYSFAGYGGFLQSGRPLYRHRNGHFLYYWTPTRNWRVGASFDNATANISSVENIYDFCPDKMGGWNAWVNGQWSTTHFVFAEDAHELCPSQILISGHPQSTYGLKFGIFVITTQTTLTGDALAGDVEERPVYQNPYTQEYLFYSSDTQAWHLGAVGNLATSTIRSEPYEAQRCPVRATKWYALFPGNNRWMDSFFIFASSACSSAYRISAAMHVKDHFLGVFGRIETQLSGHQSGRPLFRSDKGNYLYYWNETRDWHVGSNYSRINHADKLVSLKWQNAMCPDRASRWSALGAAAAAETQILVSPLSDETLPEPGPRVKSQISEPTIPPPVHVLVQSAEHTWRSRTEIRRRRLGRVESQRIDFTNRFRRLCLSEIKGELKARLCKSITAGSPDQSWAFVADGSLRILGSQRCVTAAPFVTTAVCRSPPSLPQQWRLGDHGKLQWAGDMNLCLRVSTAGIAFSPEDTLMLAPCNDNDLLQRWH